VWVLGRTLEVVSWWTRVEFASRRADVWECFGVGDGDG
jgi:hypothetical protein